MSIDFAKLVGLQIPVDSVMKGVTQIEDLNGRVLWMAVDTEKIVLDVAKTTSDTYAGGTTYTGESFVLLDVGPKKNGTVRITYGNLTKTITDTSGEETPNLQSVWFGTFNGASDSVETPERGRLTIEGDCYTFGNGQYATGKLFTGHYTGNIKAVISFGKTTEICARAFTFNGMIGGTATNQFSMERVKIPSGIMRVGVEAFKGCESITSVVISETVEEIGLLAFGSCRQISSLEIDDRNKNFEEEAGAVLNKSKTEFLMKVANQATTTYSIPATVETVGEKAFEDCSINTVYVPKATTLINKRAFLNSGLTSIIFEDPNGWYFTVGVSKIDVDASDSESMASMLKTEDESNGKYASYILRKRS